jgi:hypothetical protein
MLRYLYFFLVLILVGTYITLSWCKFILTQKVKSEINLELVEGVAFEP